MIYDAEHWFDGYKANPEYALKTLGAAVQSGAEWFSAVRYDGGTLPRGGCCDSPKQVQTWLGRYHEISPLPRLGIHTHNDSGTAVAATLAAVEAGADMVHGTMNGYGERCGNADLCSVIPNLQFKDGT